MTQKIILFLTLFMIISCDEDSKINEILDPPNVIITSPTRSGTVSGIVEITAMATSNVGISKLNLWIDGRLVEGSDDNEEPYEFQFNTLEFENGTEHSIVVRAYDNQDNSSDSEILYLTVDNSGLMPNPLSLSVTYQDNNATLSWEISTDENFKEYQLFSSEESDMSSSEMVYSTENLNDTEFLIEDLVKGEAKYYQVKQINTYEFESSSNVIKVELVDDWEYFYTIDYNAFKLLKFNRNFEIVEEIDAQNYVHLYSKLSYHDNKLYISQLANGGTNIYSYDGSNFKLEYFLEKLSQDKYTAGLTFIEDIMYLHDEGTGAPSGGLIKVQNGIQTRISSNCGDANVLSIASINNDLYAYSEYSDALYKYNVQSGKLSNASNSGLRFVFGLDGYNEYLYAVDIMSAHNVASSSRLYRLDPVSGKNTLLFTYHRALAGLAFEK